jgi:zinc transporter
MRIIEFRSSPKPDSTDSNAAPLEAWVDIDAADAEGRRWLTCESGLSEEAVERLLQPSLTSYWRRFDQGLQLHARGPLPGGDTSAMQVFDFGFWLESGRIITVRHGRAPALDTAAEACSMGSGPANSWELVVFVLSEGLSRMEQMLHDLNSVIGRLEDELLSRESDLPIHRLSELQRQLIYARRFRLPLANMVSFISSQPGSAIDAALRDDLEGITNIVAQQREALDFSIDRASALQGQIRDQVSDSLNSATYRFTWVATVFLPLSFLTGLLGINVAGIPGDHNPLAFWLVCGTLCVIAASWGIAVGRITSPFRRRSAPRDP